QANIPVPATGSVAAEPANMNLRKTLAIVGLGLATALVAAQAPAGADEPTTADKKKAFKQKFFGKKAAEPAKDDPKYANAKPAPTDIKPPAAPAHPMPTAALAGLIDRAIDQRLSSAEVKPS